MKRRSETLRGVDFIFGISIVVFFILMFLVFRSAEEVRKSRELEKRTYEILRKLDILLSYSINVETGNRGYAISGDEDFLEPLERGRVAIKTTIDSLRNIIIDTEQKERLDTIEYLINRKLDISERIVVMRKKYGVDHALDYVARGEGKQVMDSVRGVLSRAVDKELDLLAIRTTSTAGKRSQRGIYFVALAIVAFVVMIIAYFIIRGAMKRLMENREIQDDLIDELAHQNKQLDDFARMASHNIRGPATNIATLVAMINKDSNMSEYQLIFSKLDKVSKNLLVTLNELLESINVKGNKQVERTLQNFQQVFLKEQENLEGEISKTNAEVYFDFSAAPAVSYPKVYLESICHNLMSNALKYRSPHRTPVIRVTTEQKDGLVYLHVSDNGLGIDLDRVGDKLFGLRKTFHQHPDARGIGLFMTKVQIETLGGRIWVKSKPDEGSTFTVRF